MTLKKPDFSAGNYRWKYFDGNNSDILPTQYKNKLSCCVPINMLDINGNFIKSYNSVRDCVKDNPKLRVTQINKVLRGKIKSSLGYKFEIQQVKDIV